MYKIYTWREGGDVYSVMYSGIIYVAPYIVYKYVYSI